jgi:putative lipoic acid-binding regulatory protein
MDTKFDEILEFPCEFGFRVMGVATDQLPVRINAVLDDMAPKKYKQLPGVRVSSTGKYHSISYSLTVTSKEHIESLYKTLSDIDIVRYVL